MGAKGGRPTAARRNRFRLRDSRAAQWRKQQTSRPEDSLRVAWRPSEPPLILRLMTGVTRGLREKASSNASRSARWLFLGPDFRWFTFSLRPILSVLCASAVKILPLTLRCGL